MGTGAECTVVVNNDQKIESVTISNQGSGYTFGTVDLVAGNVPTGTTLTSIQCHHITQRGTRSRHL
jgi:hypothetical protein